MFQDNFQKVLAVDDPKFNSAWVAGSAVKREVAAPLDKSRSVDVAVVGGGMVGISVAKYLQDQGREVAVFEAHQVGKGVSGHSTAKLSSLHKNVYTDVVKTHGAENGKHYYDINETGINMVEENVKKYNIQCEFKRDANYTFTTADNYVNQIKLEHESAQKAGIPTKLYEGVDIGLPFAYKVAVGLDNQAHFNSYAYIAGLANAFVSQGGIIYENTRVINITEKAKDSHILDIATSSPISTPSPASASQSPLTVTAQYVILATHMPILDRSGHFAFNKPVYSYVNSFSVKDETRLPVAMYMNIEDPQVSIRTYKPINSSQTFLIVGSAGHDTGSPPEGGNESGYKSVQPNTTQYFGLDYIDQMQYRWSAMDYIPADSVPYIGYMHRTSNIFCATGFNKWGLAFGASAGVIFHDLMNNKETPWTQLLDARRWDLKGSIVDLIKISFNVQKHLVLDKIKDRMNAVDIEDLGKDCGGYCKIGGELLGCYKDKEGKVHAVKPVCTHLGCDVLWNNGDRTWDCACHGSRFAVDGTVLHGPAVKDLETRAI